MNPGRNSYLNERPDQNVKNLKQEDESWNTDKVWFKNSLPSISSNNKEINLSNNKKNILWKEILSSK